MKLYPIYAEDFKLDGGACFGVVPKAVWGKSIQADENNMIETTSRCLLVETDNRLILIDTGIGSKQDAQFLSYFHLFGNRGLEKSFNEINKNFDEVTDVILTHLHFDHCGGAVKRNETGFELVFKNATHWVSKAQWEWANNPNLREKASYLKENFIPIQESGKLKFVESESYLIPEIFLKFVNGHTEGQMIPIISYQGRKIVYQADFVASTINIPIPYIPSYDTRPLISMQEKIDFLQESVENDYVYYFEHDSQYECCTVHKTEKGIKVKETFKFNEFFK